MPVNVWLVVSPAVLTETVKVAGVTVLAGDMLSHEAPKLTTAFTVVELAGDVPMLNCWEAGGLEPRV